MNNLMTRTSEAYDIDFTGIVRPGDTVMWSHGAAEPVGLIRRLLEQRHEIGPFKVFLGGSYSDLVRPEHTDIVTVAGMGAVGSNRALCRGNLMEIVPCHLSDLPVLLASGAIKVDVVMLQVSRADAPGRHSFGAANPYAQYALPRARVVIAEVNRRAPRTQSRSVVDIGSFDLVVHTDHDLVEVHQKGASDIDRRIAANIAGFVNDGSVLQVGIGSVPNALLAAVGDRRHLGLHAGVVGDAVIDLIESGALDNARKSIDRGKTVTAALAGSRRLYDFADGNRDILVEPITYTHDIATLRQIDMLVSVNSAIEVDLTGQAGSEIAGGFYAGTIGGQVDFIRGALAARGGRSIIGLPSRTGGGTPRIVAALKSGIVTSGRADADVVATEYGAAELRGRSIPERVRRMIAIAHPGDRERFEREAAEHVIGYRN